MSTAIPADSDSSSTESAETPSFTIDQLQKYVDIQAQPASEIISHFEGYDELAEFAESGDDWEEINGVGPKTAETLQDSVDDLPEASEPEAVSESDTESSEDDDSTSDGGETEPEADVDDADEATEGETETEADGEEEGEAGLYELSNSPDHFEAAISVGRVSDVFNAVGQLVDECKLRIGEDRIAIRAVDPANVAMVDIEVNARAFDAFHASPGVIGINIDRIQDAISVGGKDSTLGLSLDPQTRKLEVSVESVDFTIALIDPDSIRTEPELPEMPLSTEISMESSVLSQGIKAADMVSDHLMFAWENGSGDVIAEGDTDDVNYDLNKKEEVHSLTAPEEGAALYSLEFLKKMDKMVPKGSDIELALGDEFPLKMFFGMADDHAQVETMLAPRIQSD